MKRCRVTSGRQVIQHSNNTEMTKDLHHPVKTNHLIATQRQHRPTVFGNLVATSHFITACKLPMHTLHSTPFVTAFYIKKGTCILAQRCSLLIAVTHFEQYVKKGYKNVTLTITPWRFKYAKPSLAYTNIAQTLKDKAKVIGDQLLFIGYIEDKFCFSIFPLVSSVQSAFYRTVYCKQVLASYCCIYIYHGLV